MHYAPCVTSHNIRARRNWEERTRTAKFYISYDPPREASQQTVRTHLLTKDAGYAVEIARTDMTLQELQYEVSLTRLISSDNCVLQGLSCASHTYSAH